MDDLFYARRIEIEADTVGDYLDLFVKEVGPLIVDHLRSQIKQKTKSNFNVFGSMIRSDIPQRVQIEIDLELFHPVIHHEIYIRDLSHTDITIPKIGKALINGLPDCLAQLEKQRKMIENQMIEAGEHLPDHVIAGGRKIFLITQTGHFMQMVLAIYPESMKPVDNLLNHFYRKIPTIDPSNN